MSNEGEVAMSLLDTITEHWDWFSFFVGGTLASFISYVIAIARSHNEQRYREALVTLSCWNAMRTDGKFDADEIRRFVDEVLNSNKGNRRP